MTIVHIKTYGCAHNMADSEVMAHFLGLSDFTITGLGMDDDKSEQELFSEADIIIFNTCTVKNPSDDKFFSTLNKQNKPVVITGCIAQSQQADRLQNKDHWLNSYSALGVEQLDQVVEVVQKTLAGEVIHKLSKERKLKDRSFLPILRKNPYIAIIPILQGCLGDCTYCKTKFARGKLKSYPLEQIIEQVRKAKNEVKEIWLVSEDNGAYGLDIGTNFPTLLKELVKIEGDFNIRIGMFNPEYAYEYRHELAEIIQHPIFFKFLHIPIQAGNNQVLKDMVRPYTVEEYKEAVKVLRENIPNLTLATDIICGFPTESDEAFQDTMNLLKEMKFNVINISKFYPRPGTQAHAMKQLPTEVPKARSKELTEWFENFTQNEDYVGTTVTALFTERGKDDSYIGKTNNYKQVVVKTDKNILGQTHQVKINETTRDDLRGELV